MHSLDIAGRVVRQILHDHRTLALLLVAPLFVLFILSTVLNSDIGSPRIETSGVPADLVTQLGKNAAVTQTQNLSAAMGDLKARRTDAVITGSGMDFTIHVEGSEPSVTAAVKKALAESIGDYTKSYAEQQAKDQIAKQKADIKSKIDAQMKSQQASIEAQIQQKQAELQTEMRDKIEAQIKAQQQAVTAALQKQIQAKLKTAMTAAAAQQQAAVKQQLAAYSAAQEQKMQSALVQYVQSVQQALAAYLAQNGASAPPFQMPAFVPPQITPPALTLPAVQISALALSGVSPPSFDAASLTLPEFTMPEIEAPQVDIPDPDITFSQMNVSYSYLSGSDDMSTFDSLASTLMGFFIFFFVFLIAGVAFLRERTSGTLERLLAAPIRRGNIVFGYFLGFGLFVLVQTVVIQLFIVYALHAPLKGAFLLVMLTNLLLAATSLSFGTLLSAFARNELQLLQFIPLVIVPQVLFCGIFNLRGAPLWVIALSKILPLTYGADALTGVALRGSDFLAIAPDLLALLAFTALFLALNTRVLRKYRRF